MIGFMFELWLNWPFSDEKQTNSILFAVDVV